MDFCKTVKEFDCTKFETGALYYIHWCDIEGKSIKAIYLCDDIDEEGNQIIIKKIISLQGFCPAHTLRLGVEDTNNIIEVQEVEFETEYNVSWKEWQIRVDVQPKAIQDQVPRIYANFSED